MNIAIMICGHWRNGSEYYSNFVDKILKPNKQHNIDLFVVTSAVNTERLTHNRKSKDLYINPIGSVKHDKRFSEGNGRIYDISKVQLSNEIEKIYSNDNLVDLYFTKEKLVDNDVDGMSWEYFRRGIFSKPYHGMRRINKYQKENNIKYDVVLRTRPDLILSEDLVIEEPNKNHIYTIGGHIKNPDRIESGVSLCDFFAYGDYETMKKYVNIHLIKSPFPTKVKPPFTEAGENQLCIYLMKNDIKCNFVVKERKNWAIPR